MTERERDELLQGLAADMAEVKASVANLETGVANLETGQAELKETVDAVSDGLQELRRDLEAHGMLPPQENAS
jgi:chromosome segregation ATPase